MLDVIVRLVCRQLSSKQIERGGARRVGLCLLAVAVQCVG